MNGEKTKKRYPSIKSMQEIKRKKAEKSKRIKKIIMIVITLLISLLIIISFNRERLKLMFKKSEWNIVIEKIHSGEINEQGNYKINYSFGGEKGKEDVMFLDGGYILAAGFYFLYSEDDKCDIRNGNRTVTFLDKLEDNWYYISIE